MQLAHGLLILNAGQPACERGDLGFEFCDAVGVGHEDSLKLLVWRAVIRFRS